MNAGSMVLEGEMGQVREVATGLARLDEIQAAISLVALGVSQVAAAGEGLALARLRRACAPLERDAQRIAGLRQRAGGALRAYADTVSSMQDEARRLRRSLDEAHEARERSHRARERLEPVTEVFAPEIARLDAMIAEADAAIGRAERGLDELDAARRREDWRCRVELETCAAGFAVIDRQSGSAGGASSSGARVTFADLVEAGSGGVSGVAQGLVRALFDPRSAPDQVARAWRALGESAGFDETELIERFSFELARLDGLPFAVRDRAGRFALEHALEPDRPGRLEHAYARMGLAEGELELSEFRTDLTGIRGALSRADRAVGPSGRILLASFGSHDGAVVAGISHGDLDRASTIAVLVPGMNSNVRQLGDPQAAFRRIRDGDRSIALVAWYGYRAPGLAAETLQHRADAGAPRLAAFLDGIAAQRTGTPVERLVGIGHSYGTSVLAKGLAETTAPVDAFVALGSAGLQIGTTAEDLRVPEIHVTSARGDGIARGPGQHLHFRTELDGGGLYAARVDPAELDGAREFSSEANADGKRVTMHNLRHPIAWREWPAGGLLQRTADSWDGVPAGKEIGYLHYQSSTTGALARIVRSEQ